MGDTMNEGPGFEPRPKATEFPSAHDLVIQELQARKDFGLEKYNTPLTILNGRRPERDALDEALDLAVYVQCIQQEMQYLRIALEHHGIDYEALVREGIRLTR